ncbi:MAG: response regulator transcription factor [Rubrivivax sp.]|nr:MAG: response regulator transcription factor [Rubrivivax sp.]
MQALIVDDEAPARMALRLALKVHARWQVAAECADVDSALRALRALAVDVVFLDIQMPRASGLSLARAVGEMAAPPLVVFVTAHDGHAIEAFELHALDYVLKPFDDVRLSAALDRAAAMLSLRQRATYADALRRYADPTSACWTQVCVRSVGVIETIALASVNWIEGAGNYVQLHLADRCVLHRVPMQRLEQHLDPAQFQRVHRGAIVRVDQIARLSFADDGQRRLHLHCGAVAPVSERYLPQVRAWLQER